jgi:hypothetical protein
MQDACHAPAYVCRVPALARKHNPLQLVRLKPGGAWSRCTLPRHTTLPGSAWQHGACADVYGRWVQAMGAIAPAPEVHL